MRSAGLPALSATSFSRTVFDEFRAPHTMMRSARAAIARTAL
jgi:hypothetical protein